MSKHKIPKIIITEISGEDEKSCYIPKRYIFTALSFFGIVNVYTMRVNLSVAMVAMVNSTNDISPNMSESLVECSNLMSSNQSLTTEKFIGEQYNWDAQQQGIILGAFFYFYIVTQLPGGVLAEKFGGKWLYGIGILNTALFSLLTPLAAHWGAIPLIVVRIIQGFGEGMTVPAMNSVFSRWAPELERSRLSTIIYTGAQVGSVIAMPVSGWLCSTDLLGGWPSAFYVFGIISCLWFILWAIFIHESPDKHPSISQKELKIFEMEKKEQILEKPTTPWKSIFTSIPVWAVVLAHVGQNFGFLIILTELPTYLSTILHFSIQNNGLLSALPYILQAISAWIASYIADKLRTSGKLSITNIRKLCNSIGLFGPALCLLGVTVSGCRPQLTVTLFSLAMALNGFVYSGFNVTHVDMSPTFSGTLYAITNAFSNFCGVIGPAVVGAFTNKGATISNWSDVFYITAAIYVITGAFFAAFASAELQPWGYGEHTTKEIISEDNMEKESKKVAISTGTIEK